MSKRRGQLEFSLERKRELDRNAHHGGRSFYFFDLDDNVLTLSTQVFLFHKQTGEELGVSTQDFAAIAAHIGKSGKYRNYELRNDDLTGSFRRFRGTGFVEDLSRDVLSAPELWKGPSWDCFFHASYNRRPTSIITARGHAPEVLKQGLELLVSHEFIPHAPEYLGFFPVSEKTTRFGLGDEGGTLSVAELKRRAIHRSVEDAFRVYGQNPHHRFGMSDDSPENIQLILNAMHELKVQFPQNSFFVIDTHGGQYKKQEVLLKSVEVHTYPSMVQLELFEG